MTSAMLALTPTLCALQLCPAAVASAPWSAQLMCDAGACAGTAPEQHLLPSFVEDGVPGLPALRDFLFSIHKAVLVKS